MSEDRPQLPYPGPFPVRPLEKWGVVVAVLAGLCWITVNLYQHHDALFPASVADARVVCEDMLAKQQGIVDAQARADECLVNQQQLRDQQKKQRQLLQMQVFMLPLFVVAAVLGVSMRVRRHFRAWFGVEPY